MVPGVRVRPPPLRRPERRARAPEPIPFAVGVADGTVYLFLRDEDGLLRALLKSENPTVRLWAVETVDEYRAAGEELDRSVLGEPP